MSAIPSLRGFERLGSSPALRPSKARFLAFVATAILFSLFTALSAEPNNVWTEQTLKGLSLRDKVAQLIQIRVPGKFINRHGPEFQAIQNQIREYHVGGVVLFAGNVYESAILLNELQSSSRLPLLVSADFERGISFRIADATSFPWTMAFGAAGSEEYSYNQGLITGQEARALGVHWIFAPVMDVNNNPDNPVINIRSYGEDPELVAKLGAAFIRGAKKAGVLTTAKHFPGHGDTSTDSHLGLAVVESDLKRLQTVEFVPFKKAIEAGVDSIMTAHVAVPELTDQLDVPATLSQKILTDLLRNELKFKGLVVTDALEMGAITNSYWCGLAAIRALKAGADVLLLPPDAAVAINEVERAVKRGDISEERINDSVRKILKAKYRMGLQKSRTVPVSRIGDVVASPSSIQMAQEIADHSITVVKDAQRLLPVNPLKDTRIFSLFLASDFESSPGAVFQSEMRRRFSSVQTAWGNARITDELLASIDKSAAESDLIVCSTLVRLSSGQNTIGIPQSQQSILRKLIASGKPVIWVSFGNPYVLRAAPEAGTYLCAFSYSDVSMVAAVKALSGEIAITGKMPVSIPGNATVGEGLQIPKLEMKLHKESLPSQFQKAGELLESYVKAGVFPGAELVAGLRGSVELDFHAGKEFPKTASIWQAVNLSSAIMLAVDSGILLPGADVRDYIPEFEVRTNNGISVRELWASLSWAPGLQFTILPLDHIQKVISRASGMPFETFLEKKLFQPLGIKSMSAHRPLDLAVFAQLMLNKGMYDHRRYFKPETIEKYTGSQGLWSKPSVSDLTLDLFSPSAFGYSSQDGSLFWIDPEKKLFIILLTAEGIPTNAARVAEARKAIIESIVQQVAN
jgi:beta-N-acetylhexosaminidase